MYGIRKRILGLYDADQKYDKQLSRNCKTGETVKIRSQEYKR
jgi:hypothetical protein